MSENAIIAIIRNDPVFRRQWNRLDTDARRKALELIDGEEAFIALVLEDLTSL